MSSGWLSRRCVSGVIAVLAATAVAACGSSSNNNSGGGTTKPKPSSPTGSGGKTVHLAIIVADSTENAFQEMTYGAESSASHTPGVKLATAAPPTASGTAEVQLFQSAQQTSKDGIALMTTTPPDFTRPFSQAVAAGIPIVAVDAPGLPGSNVGTFVGNSNTQLGAGLADAMMDKIPANSTGTVVLGDPIPGLPLLSARINGFEKELKAKRPGLKFVGPFNVGNAPTDNYNGWNSVVQKYPSAVAYMDPGDQGAVSFARISKSTGKHYLVGGCDVNMAALQAVQQGAVDALADPHHFLKGYIAIHYLAEHAQHGTPLPKGWFNPGFGIVDKGNVKKVIAREKNNQTRYAYYAPIIKKELANPSAYLKPLSQAN